MFRTYDCPVDGCEYETYDGRSLSRHVGAEHPDADAPKD
jgi:hypothetical protein